MPKTNLTKLSDTELFNQLDEAKDNIFTLRMRRLTSGDNPASSASTIRNTKRAVARLMTEIRRREIKGEINAAEVLSSMPTREANLKQQLVKQDESATPAVEAEDGVIPLATDTPVTDDIEDTEEVKEKKAKKPKAKKATTKKTTKKKKAEEIENAEPEPEKDIQAELDEKATQEIQEDIEEPETTAEIEEVKETKKKKEKKAKAKKEKK